MHSPHPSPSQLSPTREKDLRVRTLHPAPDPLSRSRTSRRGTSRHSTRSQPIRSVPSIDETSDVHRAMATAGWASASAQQAIRTTRTHSATIERKHPTQHINRSQAIGSNSHPRWSTIPLIDRYQACHGYRRCPNSASLAAQSDPLA